MWNSINDIETAKKFILNPRYGQSGQFEPYDLIKSFDLRSKKVFDFGCGVGRKC